MPELSFISFDHNGFLRNHPMCEAAILWSGIETVVFGTSIRFLQRLGRRQIDILAEEVVRRSPAWTCVLIGGVMEKECDALFESAISNRRMHA